LRIDSDFEKGYYLRFESPQQRLVFDAWPRAGDAPYRFGLERPLSLSPGKPTCMKVFVDGTLLEAYVEEKIALSARMNTGRKLGVLWRKGR
jgi:hypothetical protein